MRYLLNIAYRGTNYAGWQRQENAVGIQEEIEKALSFIYKEAIEVTGASRTDAGVHALGQKAAYWVKNDCIPMNKIPYAINSQLPADISVTLAKTVPDSFHPIFDAKRKTYIYKIFNSKFRNPLYNEISWHVYRDLDIDSMTEAAPVFQGRHDFSAFCAAGTGAKTFERTVYSSKIYLDNDFICFEVCGDGFLYNMVRIMAGTLCYIGSGKIEKESLPNIIAMKKREKAGITAPPQGLCLKEVYY